MKVICAIGFLCLVATVKAQGADAEATEAMQCITGYSVNGIGNYTTELCNAGENSCQTKIARNGPITMIVKRCKEQQACMNNQKNNMEICYGKTSYANAVHICHFCCMEANCNTMDDIPDMEKFTPTEEEGSG